MISHSASQYGYNNGACVKMVNSIDDYLLPSVRIAAGNGPFVRSKSDICITDDCINKLGPFYSALGAPFDDHYN